MAIHLAPSIAEFDVEISIDIFTPMLLSGSAHWLLPDELPLLKHAFSMTLTDGEGIDSRGWLHGPAKDDHQIWPYLRRRAWQALAAAHGGRSDVHRVVSGKLRGTCRAPHGRELQNVRRSRVGQDCEAGQAGEGSGL